MLVEYIEKAVEMAGYKRLDNGSWFAEIPGFSGVWANSETKEGCCQELREVLKEWLFLKIADEDPIPEIEGRELKIREVAVA
ncbi:type II toxin-antitoxin system HicB family antitoxin [bacterium]|nr:type II toxin-antitoxin system HicB family antitoxin [bacterium]